YLMTLNPLSAGTAGYESTRVSLGYIIHIYCVDLHIAPPGPSPDLLASLQSLGEHSDHTLLPQTLHQIAEAYSLEEEYQWAVQFLQLERLYHERLLSNLTALQEDWGTALFSTQLLCETNTIHYTLFLILTYPHHSVPLQSSSPDGLVSILKRRRASLDGLPPEGPDAAKQNSKRKVRFSEPEDGMEPEEVGGDSCLILLLLCLVTVVISLGGTALYCTLVDTYSSICTDFSHNVDFYVVQVRHFLDGLRHWLSIRS
uniref:Consortin, connexin sorting protein b n=1 Tax=Oncorhynchus mykiss TaxID=8022 RepID=A0A8K9UEA3_ONCMY